MCGIAGKLYLGGLRSVDPDLLERMGRVLAHRGPDDAGTYRSGPVGFASRRLAIVDLSAAGHQPMTSADGRYWITYNGEVYNFLELRTALERQGVAFRSRSDTEVILVLYERHGVDCLSHLRGMFAFAIWDTVARTLFIARDRLGKKPLVYYHDAERLVFGSEAKAILQDPEVPVGVDREALHHYLTLGYVPAPWSAFQGFRKLPPAHYLLVRDGRLSLHRYWTLRYTPKRRESAEELGEEMVARLREAVRLRLIADVPVGALLSGGMDSSTVVALMRQVASGPVRTFSIGFDRPDYDETRYARLVARRFETEHHELVVKPDAIDLVPPLVYHYNEPFADSSAIPSFAVCKMARGSVTVALNGDGGDETLVGYDRYLATQLWRWGDLAPGALRRAARSITGLLPPGRPGSLAYRARRFGELLARPPTRRYAELISCFRADQKAELYTPAMAEAMTNLESEVLIDNALMASDAPSFPERAVHADVQLYLPDDLLVKMDIASMAQSLEVRSPFLDHEVVEFTAALPFRLKLAGMTQKALLKRVMRGVLPESVLRRSKMGFRVPIDQWLRSELRDMAHDLLLGPQARQRGYFRPEIVARYLDEHLTGRAHHQDRLWSLLMLEWWHRLFVDTRPAAA